jgi:Tfp pilus assembly protein PilF
MDDEQTRENLGKQEIDKAVNFLDIGELSTQTIDLPNLLTKDLSSSGSFDIRGHIWQTTFGKVALRCCVWVT